VVHEKNRAFVVKMSNEWCWSIMYLFEMRNESSTKEFVNIFWMDFSVLIRDSIEQGGRPDRPVLIRSSTNQRACVRACVRAYQSSDESL
jgi:hypothetical protein